MQLFVHIKAWEKVLNITQQAVNKFNKGKIKSKIAFIKSSLVNL